MLHVCLATDWTIRGSNRDRGKTFSLLQSVQKGSGGTRSLLFVGYRGSASPSPMTDKSAGACKLTAHFRLVLGSRIRGATPLHPIDALMVLTGKTCFLAGTAVV